MPFIKQWRRNTIDSGGLGTLADHSEIEPGDICYVFYKPMVEQWKVNPRWSTAHRLYRELLERFHNSDDDEAAHHLAWQVFFNTYVMDYERRKELENGTI
jgi:hypothetical protein